MKCPVCEKIVMPWHGHCPSCGHNLDGDMYENEIFKDKKILAERREKLNASFVYSKANVHAINNLNKELRKRMKKLYDGIDEIQQIFLRFQEEGMKEFFEFKIDASLIMKHFNTSPVADEDVAKKISRVIYRNGVVPQFCIEADYNYGDPWGVRLEKLLENVEHRGVFANRAFDKLKICRMMDIVFNQQKILSLADALYLCAADWNIEYYIETSQHLWQPDEKLWNKRHFSFRCGNCGRLQLPFHAHCPSCGENKTKVLIRNKIKKQHWQKLWRESFDWNYENKIAVYAFNDKITELFNSAYEQMFKAQKVFNEEFAAGKKYFSTFHIGGYLKYKNRNAYPLANKKMARLLNESFNSNTVYHDFVWVMHNSEYSEKEKRYNAFIGDEHTIWNFEGFDRCVVGNHPINYFMHSVFQDGEDYTFQDIPYMNAEDFYPQFYICLSDRRRDYDDE